MEARLLKLNYGEYIRYSTFMYIRGIYLSQRLLLFHKVFEKQSQKLKIDVIIIRAGCNVIF